MKNIFFQKQAFGYAALASKRDWVIVSAIVVSILALSQGLLLLSLVDRHLMRSMLVGGFLGMLPSILMCLPVYGVVDGFSNDVLHSFLKSMKFTRSFERNGMQFYTQDTSAWVRWDSNRVAVKLLPNGQFSVVMPWYCYRVLKRQC